LKVLPRSHRYRTPQHSQTGHSNWKALLESDQPTELYDTPPEAVDVHADIGDFIVGDARCLHSAHPNQSEERRTCITLWYLNEYDTLPHHMQCSYASPWGAGWASGLSAKDAALVAPLRPAPSQPAAGHVHEGFRGPVLEYLLEPDGLEAKL
jgi:hypothetical protein